DRRLLSRRRDPVHRARRHPPPPRAAAAVAVRLFDLPRKLSAMIDKRLRALFDELISDAGYRSGRRSFPRTLTPDDAVAMTTEPHADRDGATAARALIAARRHTPLACGPGCNGCCEELVLVYRPEALRIARWLEEPAQAAVKQRFLEAYPAWKARVGDA